MGKLIRRLCLGAGWLLSLPLILITVLETAVTAGKSIRIYGQCKELLASVPTFVGDYMRSAYYWTVCKGISGGVLFSYGSMVARKDATIQPGTVIGVHSIIGHADIGRNVLISARVSILSGKYQHGRPGEERPEEGSFSRVAVGDNCWIGEGALVMANVGSNSVVGAGSVVYKDVPDDTTVLGNPARKVSM